MNATNAAALLAALVGLVLLSTAVGAAEPPKAEQRKMRFSAADQQQAVTWQEQARKKLFEFLKLSDLVQADSAGTDGKPRLDFKVEIQKIAKDQGGKFTRYDLVMDSTPTRRILVVLTVPVGEGKFPAVVCLHGHGGNRNIVYDPGSIYKGFALELANKGYVTIATEVGQHNAYEKDRTLMGERLWDLLRCVSYLTTRPEVDAGRIGCAGLSLGGEMAMWLGAMDPRIRATVSSGFLCYQKNLLQGHCLCWDFPGLRENFDWPDVYGLIAPRHLLCQNGKKDGIFPWRMAEEAMVEIQQAYRCFGQADRAGLQLHDGEHVFAVKPAVEFLDKALAK